MSAKWGYEWVRLYRHPSQSWLSLSYSARGLGYEIVRSCDEQGRIECGKREPFDVIALLCAIDITDRRRARKDFEALLADGFLLLEGSSIVVRNYELAQETRTDAAARKAAQRAREAAGTPPVRARERHADDVGTTSGRRADDMPTTSERHGNDVGTVPTTRNDSPQAVTVTPLLRREGKGRELEGKREETVPTSQEVGTAPPVEVPPPAKGTEQLALVAGEPKAKQPRPEALPFPVYAGLQAIAAKTQRFALPAQPELAKGHVIALGKQVRRFPRLEEWLLVGEYLNANGEGWRGMIGVSHVASDRFGEFVAAARAWEKSGKQRLDAKGAPIDPTKGRAEGWGHKRLGLEDIGVEELGNG